MEDFEILFVDDDSKILDLVEEYLTAFEYKVSVVDNGLKALELIKNQDFDVVFTDFKMPDIDGLELLAVIKEYRPDTEVIIITAHASLPSAIDTMKKGAFYYLEKPFKLDEVRKVVREAYEKVKLKKENAHLREQIEIFKGKIKIVTQDKKIRSLLDTAQQIGPTDCNVIISGESGTGKELFARYVHACSKRADAPFFAINCGAFTESILTSELFGYEKGAFTGATVMKKGLIEMASGGTLFLDEITEMEPSMQVKLLRVIQEKEVLRLGATETVKVDVRFIAATNRDVKDSIKTGHFREDLFFRLNVVSFYIPPLSERSNDVPLLSYYFLKKYSALMHKDVREINAEVLSILMNYDFPGNIRELENIIERGVALAPGDTIEVAQLPEDLRELSIRTFRKKEGRIPSLEQQELAYIQWVLKEVGGNKTLAAQTLGIDRVSLWRKLKKFGLEEG